MKYTMSGSPCEACPFIVANEFSLRPDRIREFMQMQFPCHQTVDFASWDECEEDDPDGRGRDKSKEVHCLGHLIICWADWGGFNTIQAMTARIGEFDPHELPTPEESGCFETWDEMIQANEER